MRYAGNEPKSPGRKAFSFLPGRPELVALRFEPVSILVSAT